MKKSEELVSLEQHTISEIISPHYGIVYPLHLSFILWLVDRRKKNKRVFKVWCEMCCEIFFLSSLKNNLELMQLTFSLLTALVLTPSSKGKEDKNKCHSKCTSFIFYYQHFFVSLSAIVKNWLRWVTSKIITMISLEKFLLKVRVSEQPLL